MEKILIIDDEAFIRENVERILGEDGYTVLAPRAAGAPWSWRPTRTSTWSCSTSTWDRKTGSRC